MDLSPSTISNVNCRPVPCNAAISCVRRWVRLWARLEIRSGHWRPHAPAVDWWQLGPRVRLGGGSKSSSGTEALNSNQAQRQPAKSPRYASSTNERPVASSPSSRGAAKAGFDWRLPVGIAVALVLLGGAGFVLYGPSSRQKVVETPTPAAGIEVATQPTVRVDAIQNLAMPGKPGLVRITCDRVLTTPLSVRGSTSGFQTPDLVLAAGASSLDIPVVIPVRKLGTTDKLLTEAMVNLQPGQGYRLGTSIHAVVRLRGSPEPLIAGDDFAGHGHGWGDGWTGNQLEPVPGVGVRVKADASFRPLKTRIASGEVWLSYVVRADENLSNVAGFSLFDQDREWLFVGRSYFRGGLSLEYAPEATRFACLPEHQFTTPARVVLRLRLTSKDTSISWWVSPPADVDAPAPRESLVVPAIAFDSVRLYALQPWLIGDLRLGRSWDEVVPLPVPLP